MSSQKKNAGLSKQSGEICDKWLKIKYDHVPKYCTNCKIQDHNEKECYIIHPELYPQREEGNTLEKSKDHDRQRKNSDGEKGNEMGDNTRKPSQDQKGDNQREEEQFRGKNKKGYGKWRNNIWEKLEQVWNRKQQHQNTRVVETVNQLEALNEKEEKRNDNQAQTSSIKQRFEESFGKHKKSLGTEKSNEVPI